MAGAVIGKGGQNIQKLRTEVCKKLTIYTNIYYLYPWSPLVAKSFILINNNNNNSNEKKEEEKKQQMCIERLF